MPSMTRFSALVICSRCSLLVTPRSVSKVTPPSATSIGKSRDCTTSTIKGRVQSDPSRLLSVGLAAKVAYCDGVLPESLHVLRHLGRVLQPFGDPVPLH